MPTPTYLAAQGFGLMYLILVAVSFFKSQKTKFLTFQLIANITLCLSFAFLGSVIALVGVIISCFRCIIFYVFEKRKKPVPFYLIMLLAFAIILNGWVFWEGILDLLITTGLLLLLFAFTIKNVYFLKVFMLFPFILFMIFDFSIMAYTVMAADIFEFSVIVVSLFYVNFTNGLQNMYGSKVPHTKIKKR